MADVSSETPPTNVKFDIQRLLQRLEEGKRQAQKLKASVRTSFALSHEALSRISILVERVGSPKKAFDLAVNQHAIEAILFGHIELTELSSPPLVRKSFVISKSALIDLNKLARKKSIKRDVVLENMLLWAAEGLRLANEGLIEKQRKVNGLIGMLARYAKDLSSQGEEIAGEDDPLVSALSMVAYDLEVMEEKAAASLEANQPVLFAIETDQEVEDTIDDEDREDFTKILG